MLLALFAVDLVLVVAHVHDVGAPDRRAVLTATDHLSGHPTWTRFWLDVSDVLSPTVWRVVGGLLAVVLLARRRLRASVTVAVAVLGTIVLSTVVKSAVDRPRPRPRHVLAHAGGASFPSGHALTAAAAVVVLLVAASEAGIPARRGARVALWTLGALAVVAVSLSRVLIGVHYPSDVVGGVLLGAGWSLVVLATAEALHRRRTEARAVHDSTTSAL